MHITPFGEKNFHLNTLLAISMAECLVANKILYCIVFYWYKIFALDSAAVEVQYMFSLNG